MRNLLDFTSAIDSNGIVGSTQPYDIAAYSKQLRYYYKHKEERLSYQKEYYYKHKERILTNKITHYSLNQVKRTRNNVSVYHQIAFSAYSVLDRLADRKLFKKAYCHNHRGKRVAFHLIPQLAYNMMYDRVEVNPRRKKQVVTSRQLIFQFVHFLGLKYGDSIVWKEKHPYNGKIRSHFLYFDGSGLDMSHGLYYSKNELFNSDLSKIVNFAIETGFRGSDLLIMFANKYSINGYLQAFRGNKLLQTSEIENALKAYLKEISEFD